MLSHSLEAKGGCMVHIGAIYLAFRAHAQNAQVLSKGLSFYSIRAVYSRS